jgi:hypothetical protein
MSYISLDPAAPPTVPPRASGVGFASPSASEKFDTELPELHITTSISPAAPSGSPSASRGKSALAQQLSKLPGAFCEDMAGLGIAAVSGAAAAAVATASAGSSAAGASFRMILMLMAALTAVPNTAITVTSAAAAAVASYGAAIKASLADPHKRKLWAVTIPSPMDFMKHMDAKFSTDVFTTSECKSVLASISALMTSSSTAKLYLQMAMLQMIDHGSVKFTSSLNAYITKMTDLLFVTSAVERHNFLVDHDFIAANYNTNHPDYNPPEMKTRMKNKLKELISAFIRLQDLFSEVISARASLPATTAWQFVCNMTKPLRGAICSVTGSHYHDRTYRLNKLIIHYTLCVILYHEFSELRANYMDHLHAVGKLPLCASDYTPLTSESVGDDSSVLSSEEA